MSLVSLSSYLPFLWHSRLFRQLCLVSGCVFLAEWFWVDFVHSGLVAVCCGSALKQCQKRLWLSDTVNIWTCLCSGLFKWQKLLPCFFLPPYPIFFSFTVALVAKTVREENQVWSCVVEERKKKKQLPRKLCSLYPQCVEKLLTQRNLSVWIYQFESPADYLLRRRKKNRSECWNHWKWALEWQQGSIVR